MTDEEYGLIVTRSEQVLAAIKDNPTRWGTRNILFLPGTYNGNGGALIRPFVSVNLVCTPAHDSPVVFTKFRIHDALFVNCFLRNNATEEMQTGKPSLTHHLRIFNAVLAENTLSNCSVMDFQDFRSLETQKEKSPSEIDINLVVRFLKEYLSTMRRFETLLPSDRRNAFPEYVRGRFKIWIVLCSDGIAVWFRRPIGKKRDSLKIMNKKYLRDVVPNLSASKAIFPLVGQTNVVFSNLAIVSQAFADSAYRIEGTVLKIPDDFGIFELKSGADVKLENVLIGYIDESGKPRIITLKGLWAIASDRPSLFSAPQAKERAQADFFNILIRSGSIKGEKMKRYSEGDLSKEIENVKKCYTSLVFRENAEEPELQRFLEEHPFILSPTYLNVSLGSLEVTPQVRLSGGKRIMDFLLLFEPDFEQARRLATIVEIKRPSHKLFSKEDTYSKPLAEGLQQVEEVFQIIGRDLKQAIRLGLHDTDIVKGMVLIGRRSDLEAKERSDLEQINKNNAQTKIVTFDSLVKNIETVTDFYGAKGRQPVVVVGQQGTDDEDFTGKTGETIQNALDYLSKRMQSSQPPS